MGGRTVPSPTIALPFVVSPAICLFHEGFRGPSPGRWLDVAPRHLVGRMAPSELSDCTMARKTVLGSPWNGLTPADDTPARGGTSGVRSWVRTPGTSVLSTIMISRDCRTPRGSLARPPFRPSFRPPARSMPATSPASSHPHASWTCAFVRAAGEAPHTAQPAATATATATNGSEEVQTSCGAGAGTGGGGGPAKKVKVKEENKDVACLCLSRTHSLVLRLRSWSWFESTEGAWHTPCVPCSPHSDNSDTNASEWSLSCLFALNGSHSCGCTRRKT